MTRVLALLRASHPGPSVAVTVLTALLAVGAGHGLASGALVTAAVATGQLSIGWSNDLLDAARDRQVGRADKPIAGDEVSELVVRRATAAALLACVVLSLACGLESGSVHLLLGVGSGWAYNLVLKRTAWSAVPYAVAFGSLPAVVTLALPDPELPGPWTIAAGALLGIGAHLLNALPDLADDAQTGIHGLPQRLGARRVRLIAPLVLLAGSAAAVLGSGDRGSAAPWAAFGATVVLAVVAMTGRGRAPFLAAIGIALVDVVSLVTST
ncbi:MAG: UbiA prenyltransferase [Marmoricola sp.]|nr:UbiA prenyltransferase [Marmoricola sp.]MCW2838049.1 UbiA prenyltransferase [Marmoricola sp.]